jgi:hypothetical protein
MTTKSAIHAVTAWRNPGELRSQDYGELIIIYCAAAGQPNCQPASTAGPGPGDPPGGLRQIRVRRRGSPGRRPIAAAGRRRRLPDRRSNGRRRIAAALSRVSPPIRSADRLGSQPGRPAHFGSASARCRAGRPTPPPMPARGDGRPGLLGPAARRPVDSPRLDAAARLSERPCRPPLRIPPSHSEPAPAASIARRSAGRPGKKLPRPRSSKVHANAEPNRRWWRPAPSLGERGRAGPARLGLGLGPPSARPGEQASPARVPPGGRYRCRRRRRTGRRHGMRRAAARRPGRGPRLGRRASPH